MLAPVFDRSIADDPALLDEVEGALVSKARGLRFADRLEQRYQADTLEPRRHFLTAVGIGGALIYNLFMISDWLLMRDMFVWVALARLLLITPMFIVLILWSQRLMARWRLEAVAMTGAAISSLLPLIVMIYSNSPYKVPYQLGMLLLMVYCAFIQQLPTRFAAGALSSMLVILLVTTYLSDMADFVVWQSNALFFVATVLLLMQASYFLERGTRRSYLHALRARLLEVQLTAIARTDPLTQLFNRRYLGEVLSSVWAQAVTQPASVALILLDIDHFKAYNDNYGHPEGDTCLRILSRVIHHTAVDGGGVAFRYGGEEVLVLMVDADVAQAQALAESLRAAVVALAIPHPVLGEGACVTISLGLAAAIIPHTSADALIASADSALYAAKHAGRNCLRFARLEAVG
ncbi:diguanylate cyclase [Pseudomonas sp. dw_358]|uniref:GGDEF domain-containing protein n=1 Tax=Pseudomonas sp. dw_358 TaxID=2720083 RepID=UPI001BD69EE8|nr:diguanylate cyclase [Pseudomonas sp. dw_358]